MDSTHCIFLQNILRGLKRLSRTLKSCITLDVIFEPLKSINEH